MDLKEVALKRLKQVMFDLDLNGRYDFTKSEQLGRFFTSFEFTIYPRMRIQILVDSRNTKDISEIWWQLMAW